MGMGAPSKEMLREAQIDLLTAQIDHGRAQREWRNLTEYAELAALNRTREKWPRRNGGW